MAEDGDHSDGWDPDRVIHNEQELLEAFGVTSLKDVLEIVADNLDIDLDGFVGIDGDSVNLASVGITFPFTRADLERVGEEADAFAAAPTMAVALLEKLEVVEGLAARVDIWSGLDADPELYIPGYRWLRRAPGAWTVAEFRAKRLDAFELLDPVILLDSDQAADESMTLEQVRDLVDWSDITVSSNRIEG